MHGTMMDLPLTIAPLLERGGALFPGREIVTRRPDRSIHRYTYAEMRRRALALAEALTRAGLAPGERVATLLWNQSAHLEAYFGIPLAGGVLHTLNLRLPPADLAFIINDAADRFLIVDETLLPALEKCRTETKLERTFVVRSSEDGALPPGIESYEALIATATGSFEPPPLGENDACGMCYTSGTVGRPKGVLYTHRSTVLHSIVISLPDSLALAQRDTLLPVVPMFHVNAWGLPYAAVMTGAKLVLPGRYLDPVSLLELFESERVTITAGVPSLWGPLLQTLDREPTRWKLERMRLVVGGAAAPESLLRGFDRHGHEVIHAWGMTETSPVGAISRLKSNLLDLTEDDRYRYRAAQGLPPPLLELRIADESGTPLAHDGKAFGELEARAPWVASSYFGAARDPERFTADGWFRTGDVATIDPEGYLRIVDRIKDLVKSGGEWISSCELENALMNHPAVLEACVVAVPHPVWGERPLALIVFREGASARPEELREHLAPLFPKWWLPDEYQPIDAIPKNSVGKVAKAALRERFRNRPST